MTVRELYVKCMEELKNGNGDRNIVLCVNDNEFYSLEGGFSSAIYNNDSVWDYLKDYGIDEEDNIIILN